MTNFAAHISLLLGLAVPDVGSSASDAKGAGHVEPAAIVGVSAGAGDDARAAARASLAEGNRRLKDGDVEGAIEGYRRAQELYPPAAAKIEFNIAKAEQARGDEPAAAAAFERFLAQSLEIPPEFREEARNELHRLSGALGALQLAEKRPGLLVVIDGRARGKTPVEGGLWVRPGRHVITLEQGDREMFRDSIDVEGGAKVRITVTIAATDPDTARADSTRTPMTLALAAREPPATALPPRANELSSSGAAPDSGAGRPIWKRWWFWTAVGAVAVVTTTILVVGALAPDCPSHTMCISVSPPSISNN